MGYELQIVRLTDYEDDEEESNISLEEWLTYVSTDKELNLTNGYQSNIPGIDRRWHEVPGFCEWKAAELEDGSSPWLDYGYGCISTKNPGDKLIKKMIEIANALNAKVRGDSFEYYDETYFTNGDQPIWLGKD
jgi:hypothetical protein